MADNTTNINILTAKTPSYLKSVYDETETLSVEEYKKKSETYESIKKSGEWAFRVYSDYCDARKNGNEGLCINFSFSGPHAKDVMDALDSWGVNEFIFGGCSAELMTEINAFCSNGWKIEDTGYIVGSKYGNWDIEDNGKYYKSALKFVRKTDTSKNFVGLEEMEQRINSGDVNESEYFYKMLIGENSNTRHVYYDYLNYYKKCGNNYLTFDENTASDVDGFIDSLDYLGVEEFVLIGSTDYFAKLVYELCERGLEVEGAEQVITEIDDNGENKKTAYGLRLFRKSV